MAKLSYEEIYELFRRKFAPPRLRFRPSTDSWELEGQGVTQSELIRIVAFALDVGNQRVANTLATAALHARADADRRVSEWAQSIEERPKSDAALRRWLRLLERDGTDNVTHEANLQAVKQFMWQVRRSIARENVVWHVAPIFWSKENGTGKSTNVKRLVAPLEDFTRNISVDELSEKFSGRMFAQTLVCFLDEFAGVENADMATLKSILTGKPIDRRSMHSESGFYSANRLSCIATSNLPPPHGFIDHTGARRLWSIHCSGEAMRDGSARMREFDAIDMDDVWAAVSVRDKSPHYAMSTTLAHYMEHIRDNHLRTKTSLEAFCDECLEENPGTRLPLRDFQAAYKSYCSQTRQTPVRGGYREISHRLKELNYSVCSPNNRYYLKDFDLAGVDEAVA